MKKKCLTQRRRDSFWFFGLRERKINRTMFNNSSSIRSWPHLLVHSIFWEKSHISEREKNTHISCIHYTEFFVHEIGGKKHTLGASITDFLSSLSLFRCHKLFTVMWRKTNTHIYVQVCSLWDFLALKCPLKQITYFHFF